MICCLLFAETTHDVVSIGLTRIGPKNRARCRDY